MHQHGGDIYHHKNILDFSANINLLGIPQGVVKAACEGASLSYQYPDIQCTKLREAISKAEGISMDHIICGNGAADLLFSLVLAQKPKKALLPIPSFYEYEQALTMAGCEVIYHDLKEESGFLLLEGFLNKITSDVDIIFLCNPNNPTGALIEPEILEDIIRKCETYDVLLVLDECFMDFTIEKEKYSRKTRVQDTKNLFILKAFTKLYAMPGLRLGYGITSNIELINKMRKVSQPWSVSIPAQMAGIAALKEEKYVRESLKLLRKEKAFLLNEFKKMNFQIYGSKANYIFFKAQKDLYDKCLQNGILIRDCSNYKGLKEGYYRIVVKNQEENRKLVKVLKEII